MSSTPSIFSGGAPGAPRLSTEDNQCFPHPGRRESELLGMWLTRLDLGGMLREGMHPNVPAKSPQPSTSCWMIPPFSSCQLQTGRFPCSLCDAFEPLVSTTSRIALVGILSDIDAPVLENLQFSGLHINFETFDLVQFLQLVDYSDENRSSHSSVF
ncbi:hypothetical protein C8R45DRAFT_1107512 [Mycena sanguinolenta]|nr:hypothetical protein C8R45DRAFT_1107512 [Mycena sanguinolenta]